MDMAKRLRNQRLVSRWVSENGPIGSRDITRVGRGPPQGAQRSDIPSGIKPADRGPVPFIECLIQQLGSHVLAVGHTDGETMKGVVSGIRRPQSNLAQEAADLVGGQARSDNRTVEALTKIPDPPAAGGTGGVHARWFHEDAVRGTRTDLRRGPDVSRRRVVECIPSHEISSFGFFDRA
jgi:hypothetical protein